MTDIICIGHITHDRIVTPERDIHMPGGTAYYFSYGLRHLMGSRTDISYRLITSLAPQDMEAVDDMRSEGIEVDVIPTTLRDTNLGLLKPGDGVNLESDVLGKYALRREELSAEDPGEAQDGGLTMEMLAEGGFL